jgi:hypothetical protein
MEAIVEAGEGGRFGSDLVWDGLARGGDPYLVEHSVMINCAVT